MGKFAALALTVFLSVVFMVAPPETTNREASGRLPRSGR